MTVLERAAHRQDQIEALREENAEFYRRNIELSLRDRMNETRIGKLENDIFWWTLALILASALALAGWLR